MDANTLLSLLFSAGVVHPWGHMDRVGDYGLPGRVDYRNMVETFPEPGDWRKASNLHGAGFETQDRVKGGMTGKSKDDMALANALYKAFYLAGGPEMMGSDARFRGGDIGGLKERSGNRHVDKMIAATALSDLLDWGNVVPENHDLSFRMENGTPALMYNYSW